MSIVLYEILPVIVFAGLLAGIGVVIARLLIWAFRKI